MNYLIVSILVIYLIIFLGYWLEVCIIKKYKNKLQKKLRERANVSDEALIDYVYNYFKL